MNYAGKRVLLLDGYGRQVPSLLHQLHGLGCKVTTICESKLDVGYTSRYPVKKVVIHGIRENATLYRKAIEKELCEEKYDVIFPVLEKATDICLSDNMQTKFPDLKIIAAPREAFLKAYDKQQTMALCMKNNIPCPLTKRADETWSEYLAKVSFPLAIKPRKGSGSAGFKKIHNRQELEQFMASGTLIVENYVIQEFIPQNKYMCNCYVMMDDEHNPMYSVAIQTYRWYPVDGGPGCFARTVDQPLVTENAIKLFKALDWSGFGQVSFMMDSRDNIPKVIEINGRVSAGIKMVEYAGCTPVKYMMDRAFGQKMIPKKEKIKEGLGLRYFHTDILWLLKSPDRFRTVPSWFDFRKSKDYIFSWADPIPFFSYAIEHTMTYQKDMEKRKHS
ncbi:MAG: ATP-grasp domain-containing protein [Lachnospiraceae bacterium]|nr:ATP-grasp domain-containing protein [Lachnospiraceae bacterium]